MKIETPKIVWKRFFIFGLVLVLILGVIDRILVTSRVDEEKTQIVLDTLQRHKVLSNELHSVFHSVQDDFNFFEKKILDIISLKPASAEYRFDVKALMDFLETHSGYFKVRLIGSNGQELFKIVENIEHAGYYQATDLYNLSGQRFYEDLNQVKGNDFHFTSMDANIINGKVELPLRPTVRVSKRVKLSDDDDGLLNFNIDGQRILNLFGNLSNLDTGIDVALVDSEGYYVASSPRLSDEQYTLTKTSLNSLSPGAHTILSHQKNIQGSFDSRDGLIVYSQLILPKSTERWFIVSRVPATFWDKEVRRERLTWIFWELVALVLIMTWLWKDEKKRHKDEVVQVLLKERSEFIQNVSHQLKTPLAIMINSLEKKIPQQRDWFELKKEMHYLIKVVEDMLLLAQVDASSRIPLKEEDILEIVSGAVDLCGPKAKEKGIPVRFNVDEKLLSSTHPLERPVVGELLMSAIVNLIDNAIDFSPVGETVDVFVAFVEGKLVIQVKDAGPGIPEEFLPKLFERFSRHDRNARKGTGLGLSISKKIIELHKGELALVKYKGGATFEIRL